MIKRIGFMLFMTALTALLLAGCGGANGGAQPEVSLPVAPAGLLVKAESPVRTEWRVTIPLTGDLRSRSQVEIRTEVSGKLISTLFQEGDLVRKDQLLAEIDPTGYRLALDQAVAAVGVAEAGLARARVMADHARREKERADNLLKNGGITEKDHQAAVTGVNEAESQVLLGVAQVRQAKSVVAIAEKSLNDCRILAPADGHVQKRLFDAGSLLAAGSPIYMLVDNSRLELECLLPSYRLAEIRLGLRAGFTTPTWGEKRFDGIVISTNPVVESDNRSIRITLRIGNPRGDLRAGMYARGEIEVRRLRGVLVIPRSAMITEKEQGSSGSVFVLKDGKAVRRAVEVGGVQLDRVWIASGLAESDRVIQEIGPSIKDGTPVRVASGGRNQGE